MLGGILIATFMGLPAGKPYTSRMQRWEGRKGHGLGDLTCLRAIAADALMSADAADFAAAKARLNELVEVARGAEPQLRLRDAQAWQDVEEAIDDAVGELKAELPQRKASVSALQSMILKIRDSE